MQYFSLSHGLVDGTSCSIFFPMYKPHHQRLLFVFHHNTIVFWQDLNKMEIFVGSDSGLYKIPLARAGGILYPFSNGFYNKWMVDPFWHEQ
jgi:hypothetical protein